uniref:Uncharacterized protein n=1 Tax=Oryza punctata TaxID=4537 RepID=A0A0E0LSZ3_ORYPU
MDRDNNNKDMGVVMTVVPVRIQRWSLQTSLLLATGSPLSLNAMPGGKSILGKRFRHRDLGSFLTKRSASTCSPHPSDQVQAPTEMMLL